MARLTEEERKVILGDRYVAPNPNDPSELSLFERIMIFLGLKPKPVKSG